MQRVLLPVTNSGYGVGEPGKFCTEDTPLEPISLYGRTKVDAEKHLLQSGGAITLRLATLFGLSPRMRLNLMVNHFTWAAVKDRYLVDLRGALQAQLPPRAGHGRLLRALHRASPEIGSITAFQRRARQGEPLEGRARRAHPGARPRVLRALPRRSGRTPTSATTSSRTRRSRAPASSPRSHSTTASARSSRPIRCCDTRGIRTCRTFSNGAPGLYGRGTAGR